MIVTFCGHRDVYSSEDRLRRWLKETVRELISRGADKFYLGGYGAFDRQAASVVRELRTDHPDIESVLVLAYLDRTLDELDRATYDRTAYPPLEKVPKRFAIVRRNEWMVDASDVVVSGVTHDWGGAYRTLKYAEKRGKEIIRYAAR